MCLSVCTEGSHYRWTDMVLMGPGEVYNNFVEGTTTLLREIAPKKIKYSYNKIYYTKINVWLVYRLFIYKCSCLYWQLFLYFQGFFTFLYLFSIFFLFYVFCYLLHECCRPEPEPLAYYQVNCWHLTVSFWTTIKSL